MSSHQIHPGWREALALEFEQPYAQDLKSFVASEYATQEVYPKREDIFNAFSFWAPEDMRVCLVAQDPYIKPGQAHGLAFSVQGEQALPPSLQNIFKEVENSVGIANTRGDLTKWAEQGVLLLNATLTVRRGQSNSHSDRGWERFTRAMLAHLVERNKKVVFALWGKYAQEHASVVPPNQYVILKAPHPSPFSARLGFLGCNHFHHINTHLENRGHRPIDWST
jgi:uracil-DNA glycosylase